MTYYEVSLKLQHDCPVNEFVKKHPSAVIAWWCNHSNDVLEISRDELNDEGFDYDLELMLGAVGAKSIRRTSTDSKIQIVSRCSCFRWPQSTAFLFEKHNCLEVYPAIFTDGSEWYRLIAFSERDLKALFSEMDKRCNVEIVSKRAVDRGSVKDTFVISTSNLTGGLTKNQAKALLFALKSGYYSVPKATRTGEVAAKMGLPRTTFEEHLRKAESKVLRSVAPYLQFSPRKAVRPSRAGNKGSFAPRPPVEDLPEPGAPLVRASSD